jgi:hypothetical protein
MENRSAEKIREAVRTSTTTMGIAASSFSSDLQVM